MKRHGGFEPLKGSFTLKESVVATFAFPLYFESGKMPYPAYVHVCCQDECEDLGTGTIQGKKRGCGIPFVRR
ncbi:MAG: hypothetical protein AB9895_00825 [Negativicutes bacterium]